MIDRLAVSRSRREPKNRTINNADTLKHMILFIFIHTIHCYDPFAHAQQLLVTAFQLNTVQGWTALTDQAGAVGMGGTFYRRGRR
jgi:hypothetical protein